MYKLDFMCENKKTPFNIYIYLLLQNTSQIYSFNHVFPINQLQINIRKISLVLLRSLLKIKIEIY